MKRLTSLLFLTTLLFCFGSIAASSQEIYKMTVAQDGTGDYTTIQQAIDASKAFPDQRITIYVRNGTYHEKIIVPACNSRISMIGENADITTASTPQGKTFGYVFINCKLTASDGVTKVYLGRPWRDYAKVVFMNCELDPHIQPAGWSDWSGTGRDKTAYYAEFRNSGKGSDISQRVTWSHQLTKKQAAKYILKNILSPIVPREKPVEQWIMGKD